MGKFRKYFHDAIHKEYPQRAAHCIADIETAFKRIQPDVRFAKTSKNPVDRRMEIAAYFLATIEVLDKAGAPFEKIREVLHGIAHELVRPKNALQRMLKKLPVHMVDSWFGKFLIRQMQNKVSQRAHPDGFAVRVLTDKKETLGFGYGIDILECGICKLYNKHGLQKFTPLLCEIDYITTSLAGLKMHRSGTIALGASKCDFRYEKK
ncbi:MAG: L-2-amino-thiazoline-4-carboxylic acid hydrolase [Cyclobacteriaceae bacterium]